MVIRILEVENAGDFGKYEKFLSMISNERSERIERIKSVEAKTVCLMAEVLLRREIGKALGMKEKDIIFSYTEEGKPFIENADYHFSISHTKNVIVFVDSKSPVGIDIEGINEPEKSKRRLRVAKRFFTEEEYERVKNASCNNEEFCRIWTMKEAYVKMKGQGLKIPLNSFNVDNMESEVYYYSTMYKEYGISVCREGAQPESVKLVECGI